MFVLMCHLIKKKGREKNPDCIAIIHVLYLPIVHCMLQESTYTQCYCILFIFQGVNCVDYFHGGEKPYLISGADDRLVKIWDYQVCFSSHLVFCDVNWVLLFFFFSFPILF